MTTENQTELTNEEATESRKVIMIEDADEKGVKEVLEKETKQKTTTSRKKEKEAGGQDAVTTQQAKVANVKQTLKVFKLNEHTQVPSYGTEASACFDIRVNLKGELEAGNPSVTVFTKQNQTINRKIEVENDGRIFVELRPYERMITPTGAIFDIPEGFSLKVHPRSGTSLKQGINLINQEAVIDADFVEELKLLLVNSSEAYVKIYHDERYAQGELQEVLQTNFVEITERPQQKTDRTGGLGHTGTK